MKRSTTVRNRVGAEGGGGSRVWRRILGPSPDPDRIARTLSHPEHVWTRKLFRRETRTVRLTKKNGRIRNEIEFDRTKSWLPSSEVLLVLLVTACNFQEETHLMSKQAKLKRLRYLSWCEVNIGTNRPMMSGLDRTVIVAHWIGRHGRR